MSNFELYWLAGLLEGEASFLKGPPSRPNSPMICLQMTDEDVIQKVSLLWGQSYCAPKKRNEAWKQGFQVNLRGYPAAELMQKLRPLMGKRRQQQIDRALANYDSTVSLKRKVKLPSAQELQRLHQTHSLRQMEVLLGRDRTTISKKMRGF